ncbi:hypothetical protein APHAL10511_000740 [Amanita phalloides]|nr:hypothetical protein APHAL10511_000740 [Amanita phalloides]
MPIELVLLNCLLAGDKEDQVFTVEIAKNKNVSILKKMIKEEKKSLFDHVDASKLDLFQVSLPVDDNFEEWIKNTHPLNSLASPFLHCHHACRRYMP